MNTHNKQATPSSFPHLPASRISAVLRHSAPYLAMLLLAFVTNGLIGLMSPFSSHLYACDACCYYVAGMSWAHGLVPYVDFIDVKGPLLFLIYAIGYWLDANSTGGIYTILSLCTFFSYLAVYRTSLLFLKNHAQAFLAISLLTFFLFLPFFFGYGGRTESLVMPLIMWIFYLMVKIYHPQKQVREQDYAILAYLLGISTASCFLIKYSLAAFPLCATALVASELFFSRRTNLWKFILRAFCSAAALSLPFGIYMLLTDSLDDFCERYLFFGFAQSSASPAGVEMNPLVYWILFLWGAFKRYISINAWELPVLITPLFIAAYLMYQKYAMKHIAVIVISVISLEALTLFSPFPYYRLILVPFILFEILIVIHLIGVTRNKWVLTCAIILANALWFVHDYFIPQQKYESLLTDTEDVQQTQKALSILEQHPNSKLQYLGILDLGFGISSGALPACPLWILSFGASPEMIEANQRCAIDRVADYVIGYDTPDNMELLEKAGYIRAASFRQLSLFRGENDPKITLWAKSRELINSPAQSPGNTPNN